MVVPQSPAQVPFTEANLVLGVSGWLDVPAAIRKQKIWPRARIELTCIRDLVLQIFVHGIEDSVHPEFPIVPPAMARQVRAGVSLSIAAILKDNDRRRLRVRIQNRACIAHASCDAQQDIRRKSMGIVNLPGGFLLCGILPLASCFLRQVIRHEVAQGVLAEGHVEAISIRKVAFVRGRKSASAAEILKVPKSGRIEVAVRMKSVAVGRKSIA